MIPHHTGDAPNVTAAIPATPESIPDLSFSHSVISAVTPSPTPFLPSWSMEKKLDATVDLNEWLLEENRALAARLDSAEVHCILALEEMGDLRKKLNSSKKKTREGTTNVGNTLGVVSPLWLWVQAVSLEDGMALEVWMGAQVSSVGMDPGH
jgi:hypothetical protein